MLSNAYFLAKFRFDTAENEPAKNLQNFTNFPDFANPNPQPLHVGGEGRRGGGRAARRGGEGRFSGARDPLHRRGALQFRQNVARFRLYRHRFLQENTRFAAFFKIYQIS